MRLAATGVDARNVLTVGTLFSMVLSFFMFSFLIANQLAFATVGKKRRLGTGSTRPSRRAKHAWDVENLRNNKHELPDRRLLTDSLISNIADLFFFCRLVMYPQFDVFHHCSPLGC